MVVGAGTLRSLTAKFSMTPVSAQAPQPCTKRHGQRLLSAVMEAMGKLPIAGGEGGARPESWEPPVLAMVEETPLE